MFPGVNPSQAKLLMRQMGIKQVDLDAIQVIVRLPDKDLVFDNPQVSKITMQGSETFQLSGDYTEREQTVQIEAGEADITAVMEQANCDKQTAVAALKKHNGDIAAAIMELTE